LGFSLRRDRGNNGRVLVVGDLPHVQVGDHCLVIGYDFVQLFQEMLAQVSKRVHYFCGSGGFLQRIQE
jgi:hypothetical protein